MTCALRGEERRFKRHQEGRVKTGIDRDWSEVATNRGGPRATETGGSKGPPYAWGAAVSRTGEKKPCCSRPPVCDHLLHVNLARAPLCVCPAHPTRSSGPHSPGPRPIRPQHGSPVVSSVLASGVGRLSGQAARLSPLPSDPCPGEGGSPAKTAVSPPRKQPGAGTNAARGQSSQQNHCPLPAGCSWQSWPPWAPAGLFN